MLDFDKMTVAEHEAYKEMQRKAKAFDKVSLEFEKIRTYGGILPIRNDEEFGFRIIDIMLDYERRGYK